MHYHNHYKSCGRLVDKHNKSIVLKQQSQIVTKYHSAIDGVCIYSPKNKLKQTLPVHNALKFSAVRGATSANNCKEKGIFFTVIQIIYRSSKVTPSSDLITNNEGHN